TGKVVPNTRPAASAVPQRASPPRAEPVATSSTCVSTRTVCPPGCRRKRRKPRLRQSRLRIISRRAPGGKPSSASVRCRVSGRVASQNGLERGRRIRAAHGVKLFHQAATGTPRTWRRWLHRSENVLHERRRKAAAVAQTWVEVVEGVQPLRVV